MSEDLWLVYVNPPARLVDIAPDDCVGALGSNWQIAASEAAARQTLAELLARGWERGSEHAPRF